VELVFFSLAKFIPSHQIGGSEFWTSSLEVWTGVLEFWTLGLEVWTGGPDFWTLGPEDRRADGQDV